MVQSKIIVKPPGRDAKEWWMRNKESMARPPSKLPGFVPSKADGAYVTDVDGNRYVDFAAQHFNVGHNHPKVLKAITQITTGEWRDAEISAKVILAEKLKLMAPSALSDVLVGFTRGGTLAAEYSILAVRKYSKRSVIFSCQGSYHGGVLASLSLTMDRSEMRKGLYPLMSDVVYLPYAYCYRCPHGQEYPSCELQCIEYFRYVLDTVAYPEDVAAFFVEPIQAHGGVVVPPQGYLEGVREICDEHRIVLVDDEVATGLGRTGKMFGIEHWNIQPDIVFMGKSLGSELPLGAVMGRREIMEAYGGETEFAIPCAVAIATIEVILEEKLMENASRMGDYITRRLEKLQGAHEIIGDIRGKGLLIGLELVKHRESKKPATKEAEAVLVKAYGNGLLMLLGGTYRQTLRLTPPLNITREQVDEAVDILERTLEDLHL